MANSAKIRFYIDSSLYKKVLRLLPAGKMGYCISKFFEAMFEGRVSVLTIEELDDEIEKTIWKLNNLERIKRTQLSRV